MRSREAFRRKLARHLLHVAEERRRACGGQPSGEDLKVIARCEQLAASAEGLPPSICAEVDDMLADPASARRFATLWSDLPEALGSTVWPRNAAELVAWMVRQAEPDAALSRRARIAAERSTSSADKRGRSGSAEDPRQGLASSVASDFTGGLAVVAPMIAVWQVSTGLHQWQAAHFAAGHPATIASVVATELASDDRGTSPAHPATIAFVPTPGAPTCQVAVDLGTVPPSDGLISVVPRSAVCEAPLVSATIGDPAASFALAAAFALTGLVSLKAWSWLHGRERHNRMVAPNSSRRMGVML